MTIRPISRFRFDALAAYTRRPESVRDGEEISWWADGKEFVLGTVLRDRQDGDYLYIVLGRDEDRRFRAIEGEINYQTVR